MKIRLNVYTLKINLTEVYICSHQLSKKPNTTHFKLLNLKNVSYNKIRLIKFR